MQIEKNMAVDSLTCDAKISEILNSELTKKALTDTYNVYWQKKENKKRRIERPNIYCKEVHRLINKYLKDKINYPEYFQTDIIQNAKTHADSKFFITLDVAHYFDNTKEKYVLQVFRKLFDISDEDLQTLLKLTTINGHLPTGAPLSPMLAFLAHKGLFDEIDNKMKKIGIIMTLYVDDITLSSKHRIPAWVIEYIKNTIKTHGLWLKNSKIKRFGYKEAYITGVRLNQSGKLNFPHNKHHSVIKKLNSKAIEDMTENELQKLLGKVSYIRQLNPKNFAVTKNKIQKRLKEVR